MQLTADQQVALSITGEDAYGNPVDISAAVVLWASSDTSVVAVNVDENDDSNAVAVAVGPVGTSAVTVTNAAGTFQGSLAIDVVAGEVAEIVINPGEPTDKP